MTLKSFQLTNFAENALFKSYGIMFLSCRLRVDTQKVNG